MGEMLQQPEGKEISRVTVCMTACNRPVLLERTLDSFFQHNTYPLADFIIYEDSGTDCNAHLHEKYPNITWIGGQIRMGQIHAIDTMYQMVKTEYIMHEEEDWLHIKPGFIEASIDVLDMHSECSMVWIRSVEDTNQHPIIWRDDLPYGIMKTNHNGLWSGFCFNPGLRRKSDYDKFGAYGRYVQFNRKKPWLAEAAISKLYSGAGQKAYILKGDGYIRHIGEGHHVN